MKRALVLFALLALCFLVAAPVARGDIITLKNGEQIQGHIAGTTSDSVIIILDKGGSRIVKKDDIVATPEEPRKHEPLPKLPVLQDTVAGLFDKLAKRCQRQGVIAQVDGRKVYTDLGEGDGILVGDELEVIRVPAAATSATTAGTGSDVVGTLKVTAVQKSMSTCEVVSGSPEMKGPGGELNQVSLSSKNAWPKIFLADVQASGDCGVSREVLFTAVVSAAKGKAMIFADEGVADAVLKVAAEPAEGGVNLTATLSGKSGAHTPLKATAFHKTMLAAADIGLPSAISASVGAALNMAPTEKALGDAFGECKNLGGVLYVPHAGAEYEPAWVFPKGNIVIGGLQDLSSRKEASQMATAWGRIARAVAVVTAAAPKSDFDAILRKEIAVYSETAEQYQYIFLEHAPRTFVLNWPRPTQAWSCFTGKASFSRSELLMDRRRVCEGKDVVTCSLKGIEFGEHLVGSSYWEWVCFEAFFTSPAGRIEICDEAKNPIATASVYSKALTSLYLPVPDGFAGFQQDNVGTNARASQPGPSPSAASSEGPSATAPNASNKQSPARLRRAR